MLGKLTTKVLASVAVVVLLGMLFVAGFALGRSGSDYSLLEEVRQRVEASAIDRPGDEELIRGAVRGMVGGLEDPYASYMTPGAYRVFGEELLTGEYSGVGIWLNREEQVIKIVGVVPGGPAEDAGVVTGDQIESVDGDPVADLTLDEVVQRILGEAGTEVTLGLLHESGEAEEVTLERDKIEIPSLEHRLEGDTGILELLSFSGNVGFEVREAIGELERQGARGLVLDMRGNPGGSLVEAVDVASAFLDGGVVVSYKERGADEKAFEAVPPQETQLPLVVVVDEGSASASEIVAAAIQERDRGTVLGTETYGKGSVQQVFGLSDGGAVKLTVATYYTPSGKEIGQEGVEPDVLVEDRDQQVPRAMELLDEMVAGAAGPAAAAG